MPDFEIAQYIDHTNLDPNASKEDIEKLAKEAKENNFNSICIRPEWIKDHASDLKCSAVIDFPKEKLEFKTANDLERIPTLIGTSSLEEKKAETQKAIEDGAKEIDPVINLVNIKKMDEDALAEELDIYIDLCRGKDIKIKPIFSCEILTDVEIEFTVITLSNMDLEGVEIAYKNSTGFIQGQSLRTTSPEFVTFLFKLLNKHDPDKRIKIKAAGGIKDAETAKLIWEAAGGRLSHLGTSSGLELIKTKV